MKRPGSRRAASGITGLQCYRWSGRSLFLRLGLGFRLGFGLGVGLGVFLVFGLLRAALEVGGVPAATLQLEPGRAQHFLERRLAAGRALGERWLTYFLQRFVLLATGAAAIFIDRHALIISLISERNIVLEVIELAGGLFPRCGRRGGGFRFHGGLGPRLAGAGTRTEHLHA